MLSRSSRSGLRKWAIVSLTWLVVLALVPTNGVHGQDAGKADAGKADAPKADAAKADASTGEAATKAPKTMLEWALAASGPIGVFILLLSIYFTAS